jgi:hypothetical protein
MAPGEALDAGDLLARLQFTSAAVPALRNLQHRLHGGWIEGVLERISAGRSRYRRIPGVTQVGKPAGQTGNQVPRLCLRPGQPREAGPQVNHC